MKKFQLLLLSGLCLFFIKARAFHITDNIDSYSLSEKVFVFQDKTGSLPYPEILSERYRDSFELLREDNRIMNQVSFSYWLKIPVTADSSDKKWLLEFFDFRLASISLFHNQQQISSINHDDLFDQRDLSHKNFVFPLTLKDTIENVFYVKIRVDRTCYISGLIRSYENFNRYSNEEYFFLALFYGILLTLIIYNLLIYFSIKDVTYIYYSLYILFAGLTMTSRDNLGFQFIWHNYPLLNKYMFPFAETFLISTTGLFAISFLNLKKNDRFFFHLIRGIIVLRLIFFLVLWMLDSTLAYDYKFDLLPLLIIAAAGIRTHLQGFQPAGYYITGFSFVILGFLLNIGMDYSLVPANTYTFYSINAGVLVESLFLSLALGIKLQNIHREKEKNQRRIIRQMTINAKLRIQVTLELEKKVQERTLALQQKTEALLYSNEQLVNLSEKLNEANAQLDKDLWKLNLKVKSRTKDQIVSKELSFEEFTEVFPDEPTCMRYLEEIKWQEQFTCHKCGNMKYFPGEHIFSRKCTRCNYIETIKAHTIFQGIKFPLQKSFYILYMMTNSKRKVTLTELSKTLDLRLNTCSDFKKKIDHKMEKIKTTNWEELVLDV